MLLTKFITLIALAVTQVTSAAIADTTAIRGDRLSVRPKGSVIAADAPHGACEYSGVVPGVWFSGRCRTGIHYNAKTYAGSVGMCVVPDQHYPDGTPIDGFLCDIRWKGKPNDEDNQSACANYQDSQFACKHDGDSCQVYHFAEDLSLGVAHCQWPNHIIS